MPEYQVGIWTISDKPSFILLISFFFPRYIKSLIIIQALYVLLFHKYVLNINCMTDILLDNEKTGLFPTFKELTVLRDTD